MSILSAVYYMLLSLISYLKINVATLALISHTLKMVRSHRNDASLPHAMPDGQVRTVSHDNILR